MKRSLLLENILKSLNHVKGPIVDIGFTDGKVSKAILASMVNGILTPRPIIMYGYFEKGGKGLWPKAADIVNELKNRFSITGSYSNRDTSGGFIPRYSEKPSVVIINCDANTHRALEHTYDLLVEDAIILLPNYNTNRIIHTQTNNFILEKDISQEFVSLKEFSYIKRGPVTKKLEKGKFIRELSPNLT